MLPRRTPQGPSYRAPPGTALITTGGKGTTGGRALSPAAASAPPFLPTRVSELGALREVPDMFAA